MRYMLNNKVYDTEKAHKIIEYTKCIEHKGLFLTTYPRYAHTLYKTKKGQFFTHIGECVETDIAYSDKDCIELLSENEAKEILNKLNKIEIYNELFDDLEEG